MAFEKKRNEDYVKKKIIAPWLKKLGAWAYMPVQTPLGQHGIPDFVAGVPIVITPKMVGMTVAILVAPEAKAPDKKHNCSELQKKQMNLIDEACGITGVISCEEDRDRMEMRIINLLRGKV